MYLNHLDIFILKVGIHWYCLIITYGLAKRLKEVIVIIASKVDKVNSLKSTLEVFLYDRHARVLW